MDITKYPQFQLYSLTKHLSLLRDQLIPEGCDSRCIDSTIINRAYFSSFLFCKLWLEYVKRFRPIPIMELNPIERISEHQQIRNALYNFGQKRIRDELIKLAKLRRKADYDPFCDLSSNDVSNAIGHMEKIFAHLKFE